MGDNVVFLPASTEAMTSANVSVVNFMVLDMVLLCRITRSR